MDSRGTFGLTFNPRGEIKVSKTGRNFFRMQKSPTAIHRWELGSRII